MVRSFLKMERSRRERKESRVERERECRTTNKQWILLFGENNSLSRAGEEPFMALGSVSSFVVLLRLLFSNRHSR